MKLHFETWLDTQKISEEAQASFNESFICFKVGAYRAALLSAYVGFMNVIADRILNAECPSPFPSDWGKLQDSVNATKSPDGWEKNTFGVANDKRVFDLSDDLRKQVEYWRSRRNDCAHSKPNLIIAAHVESFYAFLESNLGKFAVSGSSLQMQQKILSYFDTNSTSTKKLDEQLEDTIVHELPNSLRDSEYSQFVNDVISELCKKNPSSAGSCENVNKFLNSCLKYGQQMLKDACAQFLKDSIEALVDFLREYPDKCYILKDANDTIRRLWHGKLFKEYQEIDRDVSLFASLLRHRLIPEDEREEAMQYFIDSYECKSPDCINGFINDNEPYSTDWNTLKTNDILGILGRNIVNKLFRASNGWEIGWASANRYFIVKYLEDREISQDIVKIICATFSDTNNPPPSQYKGSKDQLERVLNDFFSKNEEKKEEFLRLAKEHEIVVPKKHLPALKKV